jgi:hypothetical protein
MSVWLLTLISPLAVRGRRGRSGEEKPVDRRLHLLVRVEIAIARLPS